MININYTPNTNIPGTLEFEHPNKFLDKIKDKEEFRYTPIVPVEDYKIKNYKDRVTIYN